MMIDNQAIKDFFESLKNTERDFLIVEGFEYYMENVHTSLVSPGQSDANGNIIPPRE
jgi:2-hydroxy-3-keto-5-methylthiopentenyl-1-phosphate phosphatase